MIELSTKQKRTPVIIRQVNTSGHPILDADDQLVYEDLKPQLDTLLIQPSVSSVQAVVQYARSLHGKD